MKFSQFYAQKVVVITGASSGFGAEFARQLAPYVKTLVLVALEPEKLQQVKDEVYLLNDSTDVFTHAVNLGDAAERDHFFHLMNREYPVIDLLINNAGLGDTGRFQTAKWDKIRKIFDVNVVALTALTHHVLRGMCKREKGNILNVASLSGVVPVPMLAVYAATKGYVSSLSEALRIELINTGVQVTTVFPGPVDTNFGLFANRSGKKSLQGPAWFKTTATKVVYASLCGVARGRSRVFPTFSAMVMAYFFRLTPTKLRACIFNLFLKKPK